MRGGLVVAGKSLMTRYLARLLRDRGLRVVAVQHPMPYGDSARDPCHASPMMADADESSGPGRAGRLTGADVVAYCLTKPGAWRDEPWEGDSVVKVAEKIFAFASETGRSVGVKCAPTRLEADEWIRQYPADARVMPYIGRSGWNTLDIGGAIPDADLLAAVDESYRLVVSKLPRSRRP